MAPRALRPTRAFLLAAAAAAALSRPAAGVDLAQGLLCRCSCLQTSHVSLVDVCDQCSPTLCKTNFGQCPDGSAAYEAECFVRGSLKDELVVSLFLGLTVCLLAYALFVRVCQKCRRSPEFSRVLGR